MPCQKEWCAGVGDLRAPTEAWRCILRPVVPTEAMLKPEGYEAES